MAVDAKARALRAAGRPVIGFGAGEPDFPTPAHIVAAAIEAAPQVKNHRYTPAAGLPDLREAVAVKTAKDSGFASNGYGSHSPGGFNLGSAIVVEIVFTALLVLTVLSTTHGNFPYGFAGLAVGGVLWLIHLVTIPVDNTSVNPARSLATAIFQHTWALKQLWAFILFPLVGGLLGALLWRSLVPAEDA